MHIFSKLLKKNLYAESMFEREVKRERKMDQLAKGAR